jgi:hypothetical protein
MFDSYCFSCALEECVDVNPWQACVARRFLIIPVGIIARISKDPRNTYLPPHSFGSLLLKPTLTLYRRPLFAVDVDT